MTNEELTRAVQELQGRPLVLLCRTLTGQVRRMGVQECVRSGSTYIQMVWDELDQLLSAELDGQPEHPIPLPQKLEGI